MLQHGILLAGLQFRVDVRSSRSQGKLVVGWVRTQVLAITNSELYH